MANILQYRIDMDPRSQWQIVTTHPTAKNSLLYVQELGDFRSGLNYYTTREELDCFLIKLTVSGGGVLQYGGETYGVSPGQFFWIDCQAPQHYYTDPQVGKWHVLWVHFKGANARAYYELFQSMNAGSPVCTLPPDYDGAGILRQLLELYSHDTMSLPRDVTASALLSRLLSGCVCAASDHPSKPAVPALMVAVREYLEEHYAAQITLDLLAQKFSFSKFHLQRQFKLHMGQSPTEYLSGVRIGHAKELLRTTDLPVSEVAGRVGIGSPSHFIDKFRRQEEMTPQTYRSLWKTEL